MLDIQMKSFLTIIFLGYFLLNVDAKITNKSIMWLEPNVDSSVNPQTLKSDICTPCVSFVGNSINQILNVILKGGIIGGCNELCSKAFPDSKKEEGVCNMLCDSVGAYSFIDLIKKYSGYLDPIFFCETLKVCPVHEGGIANLDSISILPPSGPIGTTFEIEVLFTVLNQTSTGELTLTITPPHSNTFGDSMIDSGFAPGKYGVKFNLKASPTEDEPFETGNYQVSLLACDGECGSKLPHTSTLFTGKANFSITAA
jgi:hypothetical protein